MTARLPDRAGSSALLVGAARFGRDALNDLPAVANNVDALAAALTDEASGILDADRCHVLLDPTAPHEVGTALAEAVHGATDTVVIYYAGHGLLDRHGILHLAVAGTDPEHVSYTAVPMQWVRSVLAESPARNRIFILDCCFSGFATESMSSVSSAVTAAIDISGTYTIASAPATSAAVAPVGERFTAFTGELLKVLRQGIPDAGDLLSLRDIYPVLVRALASRAMPHPQRLGTGLADLIAIGRNVAVSAAPPPRPSALEGVLLHEMAAFPRRWLRSGYRIDEVQRWAAAVANPRLRTGEHWPAPPTTPRFRRQVAGWDPAAVDAFTARYTPFTPSPMFGDGRTPFAAELRDRLGTDPSYQAAARLTTEQVALLRRLLRLPDAERLVGGISSGTGVFTEYLYFTDWGLRARNGQPGISMIFRIHNDDAELLSIPYDDFPLATFSLGDHLETLQGEAVVEPRKWYEVDIVFDHAVFTVLSTTAGEQRAARVAGWLNGVKELCGRHQRRDATI